MRGVWVERWNADRLVAGVEEVLLRWESRPDPGRLHSLLSAADPRAIVHLEAVYRRRRRTMAGFDAAGAAAAGSREPAVAALLTLDRNGHLREAGLRQLSARTEPFVLAFLLLRLNDPVEAVRGLAVAAVGARLGAGADPTVLVRLVPLLRGLGTRLRAAPIVRSIERELLHGDAGRAALWEGARGEDPAVRDGCLRLLAMADPAAAIEEALRGADPVLRHWAVGVATAPSFDAAAQRKILPLLESDANPRVRWQALRARIRLAGGGPHVRRARLDPDARVRYLARASLAEKDSADMYRATLDSGGELVGALAGLADMGNAGDVPRVVRFLDHPAARVRGEAWRALAVLDREGFDARTAQRQADPSGKVRRIG